MHNRLQFKMFLPLYQATSEPDDGKWKKVQLGPCKWLDKRSISDESNSERVFTVNQVKEIPRKTIHLLCYTAAWHCLRYTVSVFLVLECLQFQHSLVYIPLLQTDFKCKSLHFFNVTLLISFLRYRSQTQLAYSRSLRVAIGCCLCQNSLLAGIQKILWGFTKVVDIYVHHSGLNYTEDIQRCCMGLYENSGHLSKSLR